jgi:hypothetical protein
MHKLIAAKNAVINAAIRRKAFSASAKRQKPRPALAIEAWPGFSAKASCPWRAVASNVRVVREAR